MPSAGAVIAAGLDAEHACAVFLARLATFESDLEHAASLARSDWEGPHRVRFDAVVVGLQVAFARSGDATLAFRAHVADAVRDAALELALEHHPGPR